MGPDLEAPNEKERKRGYYRDVTHGKSGFFYAHCPGEDVAAGVAI